jgi:hypothetical protein
MSYRTFKCNHKFHKIVHYFSFEVLKKKIWANFQRIIELFTQKIVIKLSKVWVWDPGVKKAPDPGSGSATLPEMKLHSLVPNYYIHVYVSDLYIPRIGLPVWLKQNRQTDPGNI